MKSRKKIFILLMCITMCVVVIILFFIQKRCPKGYEEINNQCIKTIYEEPYNKFYCPEGFELKNEYCYKENTIMPTKKYFCDDTYKKEGNITISKSSLIENTCYYTISHTPVNKKYCPPGAIALDDEKCLLTIWMNANQHLTGDYYCISPSSKGITTLVGTKCRTDIYVDYLYEIVCVEGYTLKNGVCSKQESYLAGWNLECTEPYILAGNTCLYVQKENANYEVICPEDYDLINNKCEKKEILKK